MEFPIKPIKPLPETITSGMMMKETELVEMFIELRNLVLQLAPGCFELVYHTHALTSVFSHSQKLSGAFCHIPVYTGHLNLGFNRGALLEDPEGLLQGTGKLIRHIPIRSRHDFLTEEVQMLIRQAIEGAK